MADLLKSFMAGRNAQLGQNAANAKAQREWSLKVAGESRLLTGAAEGAWKEMEDLTLSDKWDASMSGQLLEKAKRFDQTYGSVWKGKSAQRYYIEALSLGQKPYSPADDGKMGPVDARAMQSSPNAGWRTPEQKQAAEDRANEARQEENLYGLQARGLSEVAANSMTNGRPDPAKMKMAMTNWESKAMASGDYNMDDLMKVTKAMRENLADMIKELMKNDPNSEEFQKHIMELSKESELHISSLLRTKDSGSNFDVAAVGGQMQGEG